MLLLFLIICNNMSICWDLFSWAGRCGGVSSFDGREMWCVSMLLHAIIISLKDEVVQVIIAGSQCLHFWASVIELNWLRNCEWLCVSSVSEALWCFDEGWGREDQSSWVWLQIYFKPMLASEKNLRTHIVISKANLWIRIAALCRVWSCYIEETQKLSHSNKLVQQRTSIRTEMKCNNSRTY